MNPRSDLTGLLEHTDWLRVLARKLAADAHAADDLVQDAWIAALERPPELARPVRGWLATVLRNRWTDVERQARRRHRRERAAARGEALPSAHDVVERATAQRRLVDAVLQLAEPFRTTVLLRFFEGLPQREIARRMQTSAVTVNSRLVRALAALREQLAREGGRGSWLLLVQPLLAKPKLVAPGLGAIAMKISLGTAAVIVTLAVLAGFALWPARSGEPSSDAVAADRRVAATPGERGARAGTGVIASEGTSLARSPVEEPKQVEPPVPAAAPPRIVRGRVLDATGAGVAGIALRTSRARTPLTCTSGADGWFELSLPAEDQDAEAIVASDPRYTTVLAGWALVRGDTRPTVVVAPRIDLAGIVVDGAHTPLAGTLVEVRLPPGFGAEWGVVLDYSVPQQWRAVSGGDGRFELSSAPAIAGAELVAVRAGFAPHREPAPQQSNILLEIALARPSGAATLVRGVVLDAAGQRAQGARVSAGQEIAETDVNGEFALDVHGEGTRDRLLALKSGCLPAVLEPERDGNGKPRWPEEVVLQLGAAPAVLAGRVLDAFGKPVAGARVWLDDPTPFGRTDDQRLCAETLLRGDARFWSYEVTDADGAFRMAGLLPRPYRLQAVDPHTLCAGVAAVAAGDAQVELRLATQDVRELVAGRVATASGKPIAGVSVRVFRLTFELKHENGIDNESVEGAPVVTGADGRFAFHGVPRRGVEVLVTGDTILAASADLANASDPEHLEVVASLRLHLQVVLQVPGRADRLRVLDAAGKAVLLSQFHGQGAHAMFEAPIQDGRSAVLAVEERAATVVLYRGDAEVARLPLQLVPGQTNVVRG